MFFDNRITAIKYCKHKEYFYTWPGFISRYLPMQHEALLYSLDTTITKKQLKAQESILYDTTKYTKLQEWTQKEQVGALMMSHTTKYQNIKSLPYILYYIWDISLLDKKILGIVGPRLMSWYGEDVLHKLFSLAQGSDIVTISGMAEGVDQLCHSLSIQYNIPTIAVLGWGLGRYSKKPEWAIIQSIVAAWGLVLSQFRLWDQPTVYTFPQRNRTIALCADILFLPEAGKKSGSLITVDFALAMQKPVYATPSSIFSPTSEGILECIESGEVKPVVDLQKFLHHHFFSSQAITKSLPKIPLTDKEQSLVAHLCYDQPREIYELVTLSGLDIQEIIQLLTMIEIKWLVAQSTPGKYILHQI